MNYSHSLIGQVVNHIHDHRKFIKMSSGSNNPIAIITIGMAGAGKSSFVQRINSYLHSLDPPAPPYILNLDPAVSQTPFEPNIDIRDTVDYHEVMKQCVAVFASPDHQR